MFSGSFALHAADGNDRWRYFQAALLLLLAGACASVPTRTTAPPLPYPSAMAGPGRAQLDPDTKKVLEEAELELRLGNTSGAVRLLHSIPSSPQSRLLQIQAGLLSSADDGRLLEALQRETEISKEYASAWCTLSRAAEKQDLKKTALEAADRCSTLWPSGPDSRRFQTLKEAWITTPLEEARQLLASDKPALQLLDGILELEPDNRDALFLEARSFLLLGRKAEAEQNLARLGNDPEAVMIRSRIAMDEKKWQQAMDLLGQLPEGMPGRRKLLHRAHMMWRLSILPPFVREAVNSPKLTRQQAAVLIVSLAPELEAMEGRQPPLMPDIIDLPSQRMILAVVRLGIMNPDPLSRLFEPDRQITSKQLQKAVETVCRLRNMKSPSWCSEQEEKSPHCITLDTPFSGSRLVEILLSLEGDAG